MQYHELLARVRDLGEYDSRDVAANVTRAVLGYWPSRSSLACR
jgi:hypothetical protein